VTVDRQRAAEIDDARTAGLVHACRDRASQLLATGPVALGVQAERITGGGPRWQTLLRPVGEGHDDLGHPGLRHWGVRGWSCVQV
jgi:hypothetical protein